MAILCDRPMEKLRRVRTGPETLAGRGLRARLGGEQTAPLLSRRSAPSDITATLTESTEAPAYGDVDGFRWVRAVANATEPGTEAPAYGDVDGFRWVRAVANATEPGTEAPAYGDVDVFQGTEPGTEAPAYGDVDVFQGPEPGTEAPAYGDVDVFQGTEPGTEAPAYGGIRRVCNGVVANLISSSCRLGYLGMSQGRPPSMKPMGGPSPMRRNLNSR
jgi:hypothetical protein